MSYWLPLLLLGVAGVLAGWAWRRQRTAPPTGRGRPLHPGRRSAPPRQRGSRQPAAPPRPRGSRPTTAHPKPGEIWWAEVPFEDGSGAKVRPCLVLRNGRDGGDVLKITSQDKSQRSDHIQIPTKDWDRRATHNSYLDLAAPTQVPPEAFRDRAGTCDPELWRWVRQLHHLRRRS